MKRAIIGCGMIRRDLEPLLTELPYEADVFWLEDTLHDIPSRLHDALQKKIDELQDHDEILLTYLLCGNALIGLHSERAVLRFLKGDDCIYACLCGCADYRELRTRSIFLSTGWLSAQRNPLVEYEMTKEKYGERRTRSIYDAMYGNYRNVVFMRMNEEGPDEEEQKKLDRFCDLLHLEPLMREGSVELYRKLLRLEDGPEITVLPAGQVIGYRECGIFG